MKKLIIVLIIFTLTIGAGIYEICYTGKIFDKLHKELHKVEESMAIHPENFDNPETIEKINDVLNLWEKNKEIIFIIGNHTIMRSLDEKLVSLKRQIEVGACDDASVTLEVVMNYIHELKQDSLPKLTNIF